MFSEYFVTCSIAIALKKAGFDEQCMGAWEHYNYKGGDFTELIIAYSNQPTIPEIYNSTIQQALAERPGLFKERQKNSQLQPWLYAAPLYQQVFDWLIMHNIRVHDVYINSWAETGITIGWAYTLFEISTGKALSKTAFIGCKYGHEEGINYKRICIDRKAAWDEAILKALELVGQQSPTI